MEIFLGMQDITINEHNSIDSELYDKILSFFKTKIDNDGYSLIPENDKTDDVFKLQIKVYNTFYLTFHYNKKQISCSIDNGYHEIKLPLSSYKYDSSTFETFLKELQQELELRIPDKFLKARGWL